jgi:signal transduction histidine kinase
MRGAEPFPSPPSNRALAECRQRLRAAVQILSRATIVLRETVEARDRAIAELQAADRAQDTFIVAAAHELNTPLTAVKGHAQLMRRRAAAGRLDPRDLDAGLAEIDAAADKLAAQLTALVTEVDVSPSKFDEHRLLS